MNRPRHWPDASATNTPSSAASFGFDVAAELARVNHPSARGFDEIAAIAKWQAIKNEVARIEADRADLLAMPPQQGEEVGASADRRRHGDRSRPTAAAVGAASNPHSAGVRRGLIALAICFAAGWALGHRRAT